MGLTRNTKWELYIVAFGVLLRVIFFGFNFAAHDNDLLNTIQKSESYYEIATNVLLGHGYSGSISAPFIPEPQRVPLYPLFIAAVVRVFGTYWAVVAIQIILGSVSAVLAKKISYHVTTSEKVSIGVGIFFAIEPLLLWLSNVLLTETLFLFLFLAFVLVLFNYADNARFSYLAFCAVLLGLTTLTRPVTQYLSVFIFFVIWYIRRRASVHDVVLHMVGFAVVFVAILSPWVYRNVNTFGSFSLGSAKVINLYLYFVPSILALEGDKSYAAARNEFLSKEQVTDKDVNPMTSDYFIRRAVGIIKKHPYTAVKLVALTSISFFTHDGYLAVIQDLGFSDDVAVTLPVFKIIQSPKVAVEVIAGLARGPGIVIVLGRFFWVLITLLAFLGILFYVKDRRWQKKFVVSLVLMTYFVMTTSVVGLGITARYRTPINVFIVLFAFCAVGWFKKRWFPARLRQPSKLLT